MTLKCWVKAIQGNSSEKAFPVYEDKCRSVADCQIKALEEKPYIIG